MAITKGKGRRVHKVPSNSDITISISQILDDSGNPLTSAQIITALGKAMDTSAVNGVDASYLINEQGVVHPALVQQIHEAVQNEARRNIVPDSDLLHDLLFWTYPSQTSITNNAGNKGGNAFQWIGAGGGVSRSDILPSMVITVVPGQHYTLSGSVDATNMLGGGGGPPQWTIRDPTLATLYATAPGVAGFDRRVSQQWVCPGGVTSVVVCGEWNNTPATNGLPIKLYHPMLEVGDGMTAYKTGSVIMGPKTRGTAFFASGVGATNFQIMKLPGLATVPSWGDCIIHVSLVRAAVTSNGGFVIHFHHEPGGAAATASVHIMAVGRISSDWNSFRVRVETGTGNIFLELNITPTSDTTVTIEVQPITGTFPSGAAPVAVTNGGVTTGSTSLGPRTLTATPSIKSAIHDSAGAQIENMADGSKRLYGGSFTDTNGAVADQTSIHGWNGLGIGALCTTNPLTSTSAGNINVAACVYRRGSSSIDVSFNAVTGVATGLGVGAQRFVYADINPVTGGTKSWLATTSAATACAGNYRVCLGQSAPIPSAGSSGGGASGGTGCVDPDAWMDGMRRARDLWWGSQVLCSDGVLRRVRPTADEVLGQGWRLLKWLGGGFLSQPFGALRLLKPEIIEVPRTRVLAAHVDLTCAWDTPFTLQDGTLCANAGDMYRRQILSPEYGWEQVHEVELLGLGPVVHIHLGGHSYAAGATPQKRGTSHNAYKP